MYSTVRTAVLDGISAIPVQVEVDISTGMPVFDMVGNLTSEVREARGIDRDAHMGCLEAGGNTYAVLGSGADTCYPKENRFLYDKIKVSGGIISELMPGTDPQKMFFPMRNRIISGLSDIVVIVEAKKRSGSLITADFAMEQGKDVYVIPGRITDTLSYGCNSLIKQGAGIIYNIDELSLIHI